MCLRTSEKLAVRCETMVTQARTLYTHPIWRKKAEKNYKNKERKIVFRFIFQASVLQTDDDTNKRQVQHGYL